MEHGKMVGLSIAFSIIISDAWVNTEWVVQWLACCFYLNIFMRSERTVSETEKMRENVWWEKDRRKKWTNEEHQQTSNTIHDWTFISRT